MNDRRPYGFGRDGNGKNIDKAVEYILFNNFSFSDAEENEGQLDFWDNEVGEGSDNEADESIFDDIFEGDPYHDILGGGDGD